MARKQNPSSSQTENRNQFSQRWRTPIKIAWVVMALFALANLAINLPQTHARYQTTCTSPVPQTDCIFGQLDPTGVQALSNTGLSLSQYADLYTGIRIAAGLITLVAALIIFLRKSDDKMALLVATLLLMTEVAADPSTPVLGTLHPLLRIVDVFFFATQAIVLVMFLFLFPDWRFVRPWTRWLFYAFIGVFAISIFFPHLGPAADALGGYVWLIVGLAGIGLQIYRYRKISTPVQQEQTKWVIAALVVGILLQVPFAIVPGWSKAGSLPYLVWLTINEFYTPLLALGLFIAILRYRLWDIDVVINRALIYAPLSTVLAGVFAISIALINQSTKELFGTQATSSAAVVSALIVATFFQPLRSRIEKWVNKYFYADSLVLSKEFIEFAPDVRNLLSTQQLANVVTRRINGLVHCKGSALFWQEKPGKFKLLASAADHNQGINKLPSLTKKQQAELRTGRSLILGSLGFLVPIYVPRLHSKELLGILLLGPRTDGRGYSSHDRRALTALGAELGTALYVTELKTERKR